MGVQSAVRRRTHIRPHPGGTTTTTTKRVVMMVGSEREVYSYNIFQTLAQHIPYANTVHTYVFSFHDKLTTYKRYIFHLYEYNNIVIAEYLT